MGSQLEETRVVVFSVILVFINISTTCYLCDDSFPSPPVCYLGDDKPISFIYYLGDDELISFTFYLGDD